MIGVEHESNPAISGDGGSGDVGAVTKQSAQRLDDGGLLADEGFDGERDSGVIDGEDDGAAGLLAAGGADHWSQAQQGHGAVAQNENLGAFDAMDDGLIHAHGFQHGAQGDGVDLITDLHQKDGQDSHGEWNIERDGGALAERAFNFDAAVEATEIGAHHVHANATAG